MVQLEIAKEVLENIPEEPINLNKLCRSTGFHHMTVRRYIELILYIQSQGKVRLERHGFRLKLRKEYS